MNSLYCVKAKQNKWTVSSAKNNKLATVWSHEALNEWAKHSMRDFDFIPRLKKINCPTLILAGQDDWICDPEQAKEIAKHIPHSQLKIFKHCSHAIAVDAHANYIQAISRFLKQSKRNKKSKRA